MRQIFNRLFLFNLHVTFLTCLLLLNSCNEDAEEPSGNNSNSDLEITGVVPTSAKIGHEITINGQGFGTDPDKVSVGFLGTIKYLFDYPVVPAVIKSISPTKLVVEVPVNATSGTLTVSRTIRKRENDPLSEETKLLETTFTILPSWIKKESIGGGPRNLAAGFSIGNKGYVGLGYGENVYKKDLWEFDPAFNQWTQKKSYPGNGSVDAISFSLNGKAYVGGGSDGSQFFADFWQYDPETDDWTKKTDLPVQGSYPLYVSLNGKGYVFGFLKSYEYDPIEDSWTERPGIPLPNTYLFQSDAYMSFVLNGKAYACIGFNQFNKGTINGNPSSNVFEYDPDTKLWTQKNKFYSGGIAGNSVGERPSFFTIGDKAYVGLGFVTWTEDVFTEKIHRSGVVYEYDSSSDTWKRVADFLGDPRSAAVGLSIDGKGYFGTGYGSTDGKGTPSIYNDFWEYDPN